MPQALITGASRGLGLALTQNYLQKGWHVIATCRTPDKADALQALLASYPDHLRLRTLDVTQDDAIASLGAFLAQDETTLDLLINNAGIISGGAAHVEPLPAPDPTQTFGSINRVDWLAVFSTNTIAPAKIVEAALPALRRAKGAKIAMISSVMGRIERGEVGHLAYCSSKAALNSVMWALAEALRPDGISVISLHPGWVRSDMGGPNARLSAQESADGLARVIQSLTIHDTGHFIAYDGKPLTW